MDVFKLKTLKIQPDEVILIKSSSNKISMDQCKEIFEIISKAFPDNKVIFISDDISLSAEKIENIISFLKEKV